MQRSRIMTYECEQCGSEIVVTPTGEGELSPIFCCGFEVTEVTASGRKAVRPKKKTGTKKTAKKGTARKSTAATKRAPKK